MAPIDIPADDYSFVAAAARQLHPAMRETFATRVHAALQDICEPGPGDVDRAVRVALGGGFGIPPCAGRDFARRAVTKATRGPDQNPSFGRFAPK
jgi:hypothetical protein